MENIVPEIERRRAYRSLDSRRIPEATVDRIMTSATLAPSCSNNQPWRFIAVTDSKVLSDIKRHLAGGNYWAKTSPFIVLACTNIDDDCRLSDRRDYALFDTGLATQNLMLQGVREGLYAHPIAGFSPTPIKQVVGIPDEYVLVALVILGYPGDGSGLNDKHAASEQADRVRKPVSEVVAFDRWPASWSG